MSVPNPRRRILFLFPVICLGICAFFSSILNAGPQPVSWKADNSEAVLSSDGTVAEVILKGNVSLVSGNQTFTAEEAHYFPAKKEATLSGKVRMLLPSGTVESEQTFYSFLTGTGFTGQATFTSPPWFGKAKRIEIEGSDKILLRDGYLTTCDESPPHYRIDFKSGSVKKDEWMKITSATFKVGKMPLFFLPAFSQSLGPSESFALDAEPAWTSDHGFQLFTTFGYSTPQDHYSLNLDYRGNQGFGFGPELKSSRWGKTDIKTYFIRDLEEGRDRYRAEIWHRSDFPKESGEDNLLLEVHKFSDADFLKDYFWREYEKKVERDSFLLYSLNRKDYFVGFLADGELDNYHNLTQRLPELTFFAPFRKASGSYWQEEAALSNLSKEFSGKTETTTRFNLTEHVSRFYPVAGGILRPFITGGVTYYSQDKEGNEETRYLAEEGLDLSWKFGRTFNQRDGSDVVHYLEPRITFLNRDVSLGPEKLFSYDDLDQIQSDQLLSFQLLNRLKFNRKDGVSFEGLRFDLKADYSLKKERFGDLRSLLVFDPHRNLTLLSEGDFDLGDGKWKTVSTSLDWHKDGFSFRLDHSYQRDASETITPYVTVPLGNKWRISTYATYDLKNSGFTGREISVWRDLHCWEGRLGLYRDQDETEVYLIFTLKAFPQKVVKINSRLY